MALLPAFAYALLSAHFFNQARKEAAADNGGRKAVGTAAAATTQLSAAQRRQLAAAQAARGGQQGLQAAFHSVFARGGYNLDAPGSDPASYAPLSPALRRGPAKGKIEQVASLGQRIDRIRRLIREGGTDPAVRKLAGEILATRNPDGSWAVAEKDWEGEARAIFGWVRQNMRYTRDSAFADTYVHPARTLFDKPVGVGAIGDCDDASIVLGSLLSAVGHNVKLRVAAVTNGDPGAVAPYNHIWAVSCLPEGGAVGGTGKRCIPLDASVDKPAGWQAPRERLHKVRDFDV